MTHNDLCRLAILAISEAGGIAALRTVGKFYTLRGRVVTIGTVGEADVQGVLPGGRAVAVECKKGNDILRKRQKTWRARFEELGGLYVLARDEKGIETLRKTLTQTGFWS